MKERHYSNLGSDGSKFTPSIGVLQRKCACGGSAGFSGECEDCKSKKLQGQSVHTKLTISEPGDEYEREADRVTERVMRMPDTPMDREAPHTSPAPLVQRRINSNGSAGVDTAPQSVHDVLNSPGQPLDAKTQAFFESRFGHDFSHVRVHDDARASESARAVNALAYTVGSDIVFGTGQYMPKATEGNRLLAHELTHVVQQSSGTPRIQRAPHKEIAYFPDPDLCYVIPNKQPVYDRIIVTIEAELDVPTSCLDEVQLRTSIRDVSGNEATSFAKSIKFGSSDGTSFGGAKSPSRVTEDAVVFEEKIPLSGCLLEKDVYHYVRYFEGSHQYTFVEIRYQPLVTPNALGTFPEDESAEPVIRLEPCAGLLPSGQSPRE